MNTTTIKETIGAFITELDIVNNKLSDDVELEDRTRDELFDHMAALLKDVVFIYGCQELNK